MPHRVSREMLHQRVWFTPGITGRLTEAQASDVAEYLAEYRSTTSLWDSYPPMRRRTRFHGLFAKHFANPS